MLKRNEELLMKAQERLAFITEIARRNSGIGKTGMMKFLYILQAVYKVPLEYDFEIYTYGPYCQTVMSDIEYAEFTDYIKVSPKSYPNGMNKSQINPGDQSDQILEKDAEILFKYKEEIDKIVNFFGSKTAKELELYSTTVYVTLSFENNHWGNSKSEICRSVQEIKPHFSEEEILAAYDDLVSNHFLSK